MRPRERDKGKGSPNSRVTIMADNKITEEEALEFHARGKPGKLAVMATKPLVTQRDLSLAYSPGVAFPCLRIEIGRAHV